MTGLNRTRQTSPPSQTTVSGNPQTSVPLRSRSSTSKLRLWLPNLTVGRKIALGYGIALGIAILGTTAGIIIGDRYQGQAQEKQERAQREINLLYRLQASVLQARTHQQQLIPLVKQPILFQREYDYLLKRAAEIRLNWVDLKIFAAEQRPGEFHAKEIPEFLQAYQDIPETYFEQLDALNQQIGLSDAQSPTRIELAQKLLLGFTNSPLALRFNTISDELSELVEDNSQELREAATAQEMANEIRLRILVGSMVLSVAIATLLAIFTSRAIAHPLQEVTKVAQQVTEESNFDLQAPISTQDEVSALAISLNQLIQRVKHLLEEQKLSTEQQLLQSEKMSSLGRMLAGVAHEINNPVNFIYGNLEHACRYIDDIFDLIHLYKTELPKPSEVIQDHEEDIDLEFLEQDLPKLLQSMKVGADRTRQIVLSLRNFSRLDELEPHPLDLHACIDSTLLILNNRIKKGLYVERNYGNLPAIEGYAGSLYQVFMNIICNAIDALEESPVRSGNKTVEEAKGAQQDTKGEPPQITITTERMEDQVAVRVIDSGPGIAPQNLEKIFETFFTTKPAGVGTGLGLSITRQIVEEKHNGQLICKSQVGIGTEFVILLPIKQPSPDATHFAELVGAGV